MMDEERLNSLTFDPVQFGPTVRSGSFESSRVLTRLNGEIYIFNVNMIYSVLTAAILI